MFPGGHEWTWSFQRASDRPSVPNVPSQLRRVCILNNLNSKRLESMNIHAQLRIRMRTKILISTNTRTQMLHCENLWTIYFLDYGFFHSEEFSKLQLKVYWVIHNFRQHTILNDTFIFQTYSCRGELDSVWACTLVNSDGFVLQARQQDTWCASVWNAHQESLTSNES